MKYLDNFVEVVMVEVGATFVGSIEHCFEVGQSIYRGERASYFKPGGSLVLLFFRKDAFTPNKPLLVQTTSGYETKVSLGMLLGSRRAQ